MSATMTDVVEKQAISKKQAECRSDGSGQLVSPEPSPADWPSYLYVVMALMNTLAIVINQSFWVMVLLVLIQTGFFVGFSALITQTAKRNFSRHRLFNDFCGTCVGAFLGINHVTYRQYLGRGDVGEWAFCFGPNAKHRLRTMMLTAPIDRFRRAFLVNRLGRHNDLAQSHNKNQRCRDTMGVVYCCMGLFAFIDFVSFSCSYIFPMVLGAVVDEWMGYRATTRNGRVNGLEATSDLNLPTFISLWFLGRNRFRTRIDYPSLRWHQVAMLSLNKKSPAHSQQGF